MDFLFRSATVPEHVHILKSKHWKVECTWDPPLDTVVVRVPPVVRIILVPYKLLRSSFFLLLLRRIQLLRHMRTSTHRRQMALTMRTSTHQRQSLVSGQMAR